MSVAVFGVVERSVAALDVGGKRAGSPDDFGYCAGFRAESDSLFNGTKRARTAGDGLLVEMWSEKTMEEEMRRKPPQ